MTDDVDQQPVEERYRDRIEEMFDTDRVCALESCQDPPVTDGEYCCLEHELADVDDIEPDFAAETDSSS